MFSVNDSSSWFVNWLQANLSCFRLFSAFSLAIYSVSVLSFAWWFRLNSALTMCLGYLCSLLAFVLILSDFCEFWLFKLTFSEKSWMSFDRLLCLPLTQSLFDSFLSLLSFTVFLLWFVWISASGFLLSCEIWLLVFLLYGLNGGWFSSSCAKFISGRLLWVAPSFRFLFTPEALMLLTFLVTVGWSASGLVPLYRLALFLWLSFSFEILTIWSEFWWWWLAADLHFLSLLFLILVISALLSVAKQQGQSWFSSSVNYGALI